MCDLKTLLFGKKDALNNVDWILDEDHSLLYYTRSMPFSNMAVRRAFMTWMHLGDQVGFKEACNYYHRLENLEDKMSFKHRSLSRYLEFNMRNNAPPQTDFFCELFPNLYFDTKHVMPYVRTLEAIRNDAFVFHLNGFSNIDFIGSSKKEIHLASDLVRKYCIERQISLTVFLNELKDFLQKTESGYTVKFVLMYIKRRALNDELAIIKVTPTNFDFLNMDNEDEGVKEERQVEATKIAKPVVARKSRTAAIFPISPKVYKDYYPIVDSLPEVPEDVEPKGQIKDIAEEADIKLQTKNLPAKNLEVNNLPANNVLTKNLPEKDLAEKNLAEKNLSAGNLLANMLLSNNLPAKDLPANNIPANLGRLVKRNDSTESESGISCHSDINYDINHNHK